jgi:hypothetical protein
MISSCAKGAGRSYVSGVEVFPQAHGEVPARAKRRRMDALALLAPLEKGGAAVRKAEPGAVERALRGAVERRQSLDLQRSLLDPEVAQKTVGLTRELVRLVVRGCL